MKKISLFTILTVLILIFNNCNFKQDKFVSPNQFKGSDTQRIQAAVDKASATSKTVKIPPKTSGNSAVWLIDNAILLPGNITVILDNCTIQLSDKCRDNMFRSKNAGIGIKNPEWIQNISIIGNGNVLLKGAKNPRSTGDSGKTLSLNPEKDIKESGNWSISYGTDAGKEYEKQTGDWRNILILMAYVDGFKLKNVQIENTHAWAVSHERVVNAELSDIKIINPETSDIDGKNQIVRNRDGINLRHGCKNFRIDNISGITGDDFIALSILGLHSEENEGGSLNSTMVTTRKWNGPEDETENIYITNIVCESSTRAVAIRANDVAAIQNVFISGIIFKGGYNAMLVGGKGYGKDSQPGKINNIHAMNITGDGRSLIQIEEEIANCSFINGLYHGTGELINFNKIEKNDIENIIIENLVKIRD